jgi:hypothetical protein
MVDWTPPGGIALVDFSIAYHHASERFGEEAEDPFAAD